MNAEFPSKLRFLFEPHRYKVAHGGRGSGKSWSYARALLIQGAGKKLRILCTREVQKSIRDSVHRLLKDQIESLKLSSHYRVLNNEIRGVNGTEFIFSGLSDQTVDSIKSFEGVDIVWVEEAQRVSKRSWEILIPTIRKDGSEIWVTMNPELDTDNSYARFIRNPPEDCHVEQVNWSDNKWFPATLHKERLAAKISQPRDEYEHVWEGRTRKTLSGAIYAREVEEAFLNGRIRQVPHDPMLATHTVWDLGWSDSMSIILVQRVASEVRVIGFMEDSFRTIESYIKDLNETGYRFGIDYIPHDGRHKNIQTGKSAIDILESLGRRVEEVPNIGVNNGIRSARMMFPRVFFDEESAKPLVNHLGRYRRGINKVTNEPGSPLHDEHSHAADAFRYLSLVVDQMESGLPRVEIKDGWRKVISRMRRGSAQAS